MNFFAPGRLPVLMRHGERRDMLVREVAAICAQLLGCVQANREISVGGDGTVSSPARELCDLRTVPENAIPLTLTTENFATAMDACV